MHGSDRLTYRLTYLSEVKRTARRSTAVTSNALPEGFGPLERWVGLEGGGSFGFTQSVCP